MKTMPALAVIIGLALASCAGGDDVATAQQAPVVAPMPAIAPQTITAPIPGVGPVWQVRRVSCRQLLASPESERQSAIMFYYGWLSGRAKIEAIDTNKMAGDLQRVMDQCARTPDLTVADAFQQKLTTPARWIWQLP